MPGLSRLHLLTDKTATSIQTRFTAVKAANISCSWILCQSVSLPVFAPNTEKTLAAGIVYSV
jgi:hypothetical protein